MNTKGLLALQVVPWSKTREPDAIIDNAIKAIAQSGLSYRVGPCETVLEGRYDELMEVLRKINEKCFEAGAERLMLNVKIEMKSDTDLTINSVMAEYGG